MNRNEQISVLDDNTVVEFVRPGARKDRANEIESLRRLLDHAMLNARDLRMTALAEAIGAAISEIDRSEKETCHMMPNSEWWTDPEGVPIFEPI